MRLTRAGDVAIGVVGIGIGACSHAPRQNEPAPPAVVAAAPVSADSLTSKVPVVEMPRRASRPGRIRPSNSNTVDTFVLHVPLPSDSGECGSPERAPTGEGNMVLLFFPSRAEPTAVSIVVTATNGRLIRFTDRRGGLRISNPPGLTRAQRDSAIVEFMRKVPRTTITLEYLTGRATVVNEGADQPSDRFSVPIHYIARHPRYDAPDDRARAIVARCS